jgi:hypothetical protein
MNPMRTMGERIENRTHAQKTLRESLREGDTRVVFVHDFSLSGFCMQGQIEGGIVVVIWRHRKWLGWLSSVREVSPPSSVTRAIFWSTVPCVSSYSMLIIKCREKSNTNAQIDQSPINHAWPWSPGRFIPFSRHIPWTKGLRTLRTVRVSRCWLMMWTTHPCNSSTPPLPALPDDKL